MADEFNMLATVKAALGIQGNFQDATLQTYINEINEYLLAAGVGENIVGTECTAGAVARGVSDLWNYGSGEGKLSPYFYERAIQLSKQVVDSDGV